MTQTLMNLLFVVTAVASFSVFLLSDLRLRRNG